MELDLVIFLNEFSVTEWVDAILKIKEVRQENKAVIKNKIIELGFDSAANTKQIEAKYLAMVRDNL
jgi:hypothetical protein